MAYAGIKGREAGQVGLEVGSSAAVAAGGVLLAGAEGTAAAGAISGLLAGAGVTASVPVVGWVLAAVTVTVAGIISLVGHAKRKTLVTSQVVQLAKLYNIPEIASDPAWVIDALNMGYHQRQLEGKRLEEKLRKGKGKEWEVRTKLSFIGVLELYDLMDRRRAAGLRPVPVSQAEIQAMVLRGQQEGAAIQSAYTKRKVGIFAIISVVVLVAASTRRKK